MRTYVCCLSLLVFSACADNPYSCPPESEWDWMASLCAAPKVLHSCFPPPWVPATCPAQVFENLSWFFNERNYGKYEELLSPDFRFVDEITMTETDRKQEIKTVTRVFDTYRGVYFGLYGDPAEKIDQEGCQKACGLVQMRLSLDVDSGFVVNDETCLTVCPNYEDDLWHLTEWRILRAVPTAPEAEGFEVMTWGEVKRRNPDS